MRNKILNVLIVLCFCVLCYSIYRIVMINNEYRVGEKTYDSIVSSVVSPVQQEGKPAIPNPNPNPIPITVNFDALMNTSNLVIGWIYSENTVINYPVMQEKDNSYYLNHLIDGTYNKSGSIFMDYRSSKQFADLNTIIYGHNMKNGSMFATLLNYQKQSYYDKHPVMYFLTPGKNYRIEIFSAYTTDPDSNSYMCTYSSKDEYVSYLEGLVRKSNFKSDVSVTGEDHIVTLSTCTNENNNTRYVLHGKLVPIS